VLKLVQCNLYKDRNLISVERNNTSLLGFKKKNFIIEKQIAWHFVKYSENLSTPLVHVTQIIHPFLNSRISADHDEWV